jgi:hypothetical protein
MHRLGAEKCRRHRHLTAEHEKIDVQMMTVDLPAPGLFFGGCAHDAEPIQILAELVELASHFHDGLVKPHDVPRGLKSLGAEAFFEQSQRVIKLAVGHGKQRHTVAHDRAVDIAPQAPFGRVDGEERVAALLGIERGEKRFSGFADRLRRNSGLLNGK